MNFFEKLMCVLLPPIGLIIFAIYITNPDPNQRLRGVHCALYSILGLPTIYIIMNIVTLISNHI